MENKVVILDTVTLRHFLLLGRVPLLRQWLNGDLCIPETVHRELLCGVTAHDPRTLSPDPQVARLRSERFKNYPAQLDDLGVQILPELLLEELGPDSLQVFVALETQTRPPIHAGEKEVILWAYKRGYRICTDDRGAYQTIQNLQRRLGPGIVARPSLEVVGTPGMLAEQIRRGYLDPAEAAAFWTEVREVWRRAPNKNLTEVLAGEYW